MQKCPIYHYGMNLTTKKNSENIFQGDDVYLKGNSADFSTLSLQGLTLRLLPTCPTGQVLLKSNLPHLNSYLPCLGRTFSGCVVHTFRSLNKKVNNPKMFYHKMQLTTCNGGLTDAIAV